MRKLETFTTMIFISLCFFGCEKIDVPENKEATVLTVDAVRLETLSTGTKVEKQVPIFISIFLIPQGKMVKPEQSIFDIGKGYIIDTNNKEIQRTYIERESDGFLAKSLDEGSYFVCVMRDDESMKYSYTTVNVPKHKTTAIKKVFQSNYPKGSFEKW